MKLADITNHPLFEKIDEPGVFYSQRELVDIGDKLSIILETRMMEEDDDAQINRALINIEEEIKQIENSKRTYLRERALAPSMV